MPDSFNDDDHHDHDSPDFVDVEIPHTARVASSRESSSINITHNSNTATSIHASGCVRREPVVDLTAMMWVSRSALLVPLSQIGGPSLGSTN